MNSKIKRDMSLNNSPTIGNPEDDPKSKNLEDAPKPEVDLELQELKPKMVLGQKYRLEKQSGQGGMGVVWKAYDLVAERSVALKFVPKEIRHQEEAMLQVKKTFQTFQDLQHPNICPVYMLEKDEKFGYYIVMKWLDGMTLNEFRLRKRFRKEWILQILKPLAAALDYAHLRKVIHRDVKPGNIFFQQDQNGKIWNVQLIDFGLAAEIQVSMMRYSIPQLKTSGTFAYMPPEQWRGEIQDAHTDQYALATVAYELYSGHLPFMAPNIEMLRLCVFQDQPKPIANVPNFVNAALQKALAKDRNERFNTCMEFVTALTPPSVLPVPPIRAVPILLPAKTASATTVPPVAQEPFRQLFSQDRPPIVVQEREKRQRKKIQKQKFHIAGSIIAFVALILLFLFLHNESAKREQIAATEREQIAATEREQIAATERERIAEAEREQIAEAERERIAAAERERIAAAERKRIAEAERKRIAEAEREQIAEAERERIAAAVQLQKETAPNNEIRLVKTINGMEYAFRWCPAGEFTTSYHNRKIHVRLTQGFWMLETEVTQAMWVNVMRYNPSKFKGANHPVEWVNWEDCQKFCERLRSLGLNVYLPTEAQWEYACRAGTTTHFNNGKNFTSGVGTCNNLDEVGWYLQNSGGRHHPVGQKKPNAWGLYDMHGNVWEWCQDFYVGYPNGSLIDPTGPPTGKGRVNRGGSYDCNPGDCVSARRASKTVRSQTRGFRIVLVP